jgi:hypothetical protein
MSSSTKAVNPQRWFSAWRSTARAAPADDPADVGTAFGLELSMSNAPAEPVTSRPSWVRRLKLRRHSAT